MKTSLKLSLALLAMGCMGSTFGQSQPIPDSLAADFSRLVHLLETTHPDPYSGFGGRVMFLREARKVEDQLKKQASTTEDFRKAATKFMANIQDGHTYLFSTQKTNLSVFLPVSFRTIPGGIILGTVPADQQALLGSKVLAINGIPMNELLQRIKQSVACENDYGAYQKIAGMLYLLPMLPEPKDGNSFDLLIETPAGKQQTMNVPFISTDKRKEYKTVYSKKWEGTPKSDPMGFGFADKEKQVMLFKISSIMARENFEFLLNNKWDGAYNYLSDFYKNTLKQPLPQDTAKAVAQIPSFSETFYDMLSQMKQTGAKTLIIDLRDNGGGFTPITLPGLYMLYGDRYLTTNMHTSFYQFVSPLYMNKINTTLEAYNKRLGGNFKFGDIVGEEDKDPNSAEIERYRKGFIASAMSNTKELLEAQQGQPVYTPEKVYVITNARTFSAAFHFAFYLWKMGAEVVGVSSSQAPNTFMEQTPFTLPYTGISGSISNSAQYFLPANDPRAKTFFPSLEPSYKDYKKHGFSLDTELLFLLDRLTKK